MECHVIVCMCKLLKFVVQVLSDLTKVLLLVCNLLAGQPQVLGMGAKRVRLKIALVAEMKTSTLQEQREDERLRIESESRRRKNLTRWYLYENSLLQHTREKETISTNNYLEACANTTWILGRGFCLRMQQPPGS